jgi:hypothetical protein
MRAGPKSGNERGEAGVGRTLTGAREWVRLAVAVEEAEPLAVRLLHDAAAGLSVRGSR